MFGYPYLPVMHQGSMFAFNTNANFLITIICVAVAYAFISLKEQSVLKWVIVAAIFIFNPTAVIAAAIVMLCFKLFSKDRR